jgi:hypothetical protein
LPPYPPGPTPQRHGRSRCAPWETVTAHHPEPMQKHGRSRCSPRSTVVHRRRSRRDPDGDLHAENHPAATIPGVSMSFAGCPSGGGGVREWEEERQAAAALGSLVPPGMATRGRGRGSGELFH